jgi:hypothetical protein
MQDNVREFMLIFEKISRATSLKTLLQRVYYKITPHTFHLFIRSLSGLCVGKKG